MIPGVLIALVTLVVDPFLENRQCYEARLTMKNLCETLQGHSVGSFVKPNYMGRQPAEQFKNALSEFGTIKTARFSIHRGDQAGCGANLFLTSPSGTAETNFYARDGHLVAMAAIHVSDEGQPELAKGLGQPSRKP